MKLAAIAGISLIVALVILFEWQRMNHDQYKEKAACIALSVIGWAFAVLLVFFPDLPGPTQWVEYLFHPFGRLLEK